LYKSHSPEACTRAGLLRAFFFSTRTHRPDGQASLSKEQGYKNLADSLQNSYSTAQRVVRSFRRTLDVLESKQGRHAKRLNIVANEDVHKALQEHCAAAETGTLTSANIKVHLDTQILPMVFPDMATTPTVCLTSVKCMMKLIGWKFKGTGAKDVYVDGHERWDVVNARTLFLRELQALETRYDYASWLGCENTAELQRPPMAVGFRERWSQAADPEAKAPFDNVQPSAFWHRFLGKIKVVPVYHDESTTYACDTVRKAWLASGGKLQKKGMGLAIMVSGYMCPCCPHLLQKNGPTSDNPTRVPLYSARDGCKTGANSSSHTCAFR